MTQKLSPAFINKKDVTTDWIEEIFDDAECMHIGHTFIGFVQDAACSCYITENCVCWYINNKCGGNEFIAYSSLLERLQKRDTDTSSLVVKYDCRPKDFSITQSFYFVKEE